MVILVGCPSNKIKVEGKSVQRTPLNIADLHHINYDDIKLYMITPDNYNYAFDLAEKETGKKVLVAVTTKDYNTLVKNNLEIIDLLLSQRFRYKSCEDYYIDD